MPDSKKNNTINIEEKAEDSTIVSGDKNVIHIHKTASDEKDKKYKINYLMIFFAFLIVGIASASTIYYLNYQKNHIIQQTPPPKIPPKFGIENRILRSDTALIIKSGNESANRKQPLTVEVDGLPFDEKGIPVENSADNKRQYWHFSLTDQNPPPEMLKDGEHRIRAGFIGEELVDIQKIIFRSATVVQISQANGTTPDAKEKIKINVKPLVTHGEIRYSLTINSNLSDADVRIVNPQIDYQPGIRLRPGLYQIQVSREGFRTKEDRIEIKDQDVVHPVTLEEIKYAMAVNTDPSDAAVRIMNISEPYKRGILLKPGTYDIRVSKAGYKPFKETKEIKDSDLIFSILLEKIPESPPKQPVAKSPEYRRRQESVTTDEPEKSSDLKRDKDDRTRSFKNISNNFKDNKNGTITDHATGLMWQKSGSPNTMHLTETPGYIEDINHKKFAGYNDWRLPTIDELESLLSSEKQAAAYISPIFDQEQNWCWTSGKDEAWSVNFDKGKVEKCAGHYYVRAVRSVK